MSSVTRFTYTEDHVNVINKITNFNFDIFLIKGLIHYSFGMGLIFGILKYLIYRTASKDCFIFGILYSLIVTGIRYLMYLINNKINNNISDMEMERKMKLKFMNIWMFFINIIIFWIVILIIYLSRK